MENNNRIKEIIIKEISIINLISSLISRSIPLESVYQEILKNAMEILEMDAGILRIIDDETGELVIAAHIGYSEDFIKDVVRIKPGQRLSGKAILSGEIIIKDITEYPDLQTKLAFEKEGIKSTIIIPFKGDTKFIGTITTAGKEIRSFSSEDIQFLSSLGNLLGAVIENSRLIEEIRNKNEQILLLYEISKSLVELKNLDQTLSLIIESATKLLKANSYNIRILNENNELVIVKSYGASQEYRTEARILRPGEGLAGKCVVEGIPIISEDILSDPRIKFKDIHQKEGTRSIIAVPMKIENKIIGSLSLRFSEVKKFSEEDISNLTMFVNLAAICINNSRIHEELEKAYLDLKRMQENIINAEKLSSIGKLVHGIAHYVNNALAIIMGHAQLSLMTEEGLSEKLKKRLKIIEETTKKVSRIIYQLQDYGNINKTIKIEESLVDLNQLINEAIEFIEPLIEEYEQKKSISLKLSTNLSRIPDITGDSSRLKEALLNILTNAIEASDESGKIYVSSRFESGRILIEIADEGRGMPEECRRKIFDPLFTTKEPPHLGLGLSTTHSIIKSYGGEILIFPCKDKGTKFSIYLPIRRK